RQKSESDAIVAEIVPASSAHRSGIRPGDRIVKFAHWNRGKLEDLRTIIQTSPKEVTAQVERVGEPSPIDVRVELGGEPIRVGISWQTDDAYPNSIVLNRVLPDSPADRAGMKVADIVTMLDGNPISSDQIFREQILKTAGPLLLTIDRDGRPMDISVNLFLPPLNGTTRDADSTGN
ncbi:MAG: PDZ domain-containing protein, partial [Planctomycetes bacterium]|nr:PDZ domain-containing protein [Planctomycetota bacterium]